MKGSATMTDINKEYEKEYYDEYRNNYYNPDDDDAEPGINLNWKRIQKGFHSVAAGDQETAETLSGMQANLETLNTDVETLKTDVDEIKESVDNLNTAVETAEQAAEAAAASEAAAQAAQAAAEEVAESIPEDYTELSDDVSELKNALTPIELIDFVAYSGDISTETGKYVNYSGVRGDAAWNKLYTLTPANGQVVKIMAYASLNAVPAFWYNGVAYPASAQPEAAEYSGYIIGDGTSLLRVNSVISDGTEVQPPDILVDAHAPDETRQKADTLETISDSEHGTHVITNDTPNRFILANYVQGTLDGYTLKEFTTSVDAVYLVYSEVEAARAAGGFPIALCNGIPYVNTTGKGYFIIIGNGEKCYVNSLTDAPAIIDQYCFKAFVDRIPNVFRMFDNIVCCGDSLTYSQVWNSSTSQRQALVPYPKAVEKITGTITDILAVAGYTCENWWSAFGAQITGSKKLYLIYLGTNDSNMTDTVSNDCVGDDPSQYAETPCGYYGRIIKTIQDSGSKCILIKVALGSSGNARNTAIASLGTRFSVPVINNPQYVLNDLYYHYGDDGEYYNTIHLNDMGYEAFAEYIVKAVNALPLATKYSLMP